ncbi:MAG: hypothetical protein AB8G86_14380 [Saprospiraceae bacterium]
MSNFIKNTIERHPKTMLSITSTLFIATLVFRYLNQEHEEIGWMVGFVLGVITVFMLILLRILYSGKIN